MKVGGEGDLRRMDYAEWITPIELRRLNYAEWIYAD